MKFKYWITVIITRYTRCINKIITYHFCFMCRCGCWTMNKSFCNTKIFYGHFVWPISIELKIVVNALDIWTVVFTVYDCAVSSVPEFHNTFMWIFVNKPTSTKATELVWAMKWVNQHDMQGMEKYFFFS